MAGCTATKRDGTPCKGNPAPGLTVCWAHDPKTAATRQALGRKGGQEAGKGRPSAGSAEIAELRATLKGMAGQVYKGTMETSMAYVLNTIIGTRLRLIEIERKLKETEDLEARIAALETAPPRSA